MNRFSELTFKNNLFKGSVEGPCGYACITGEYCHTLVTLLHGVNRCGTPFGSVSRTPHSGNRMTLRAFGFPNDTRYLRVFRSLNLSEFGLLNSVGTKIKEGHFLSSGF